MDYTPQLNGTNGLDVLLQQLSRNLSAQSYQSLAAILDSQPAAAWKLRLLPSTALFGGPESELIDALSGEDPPQTAGLQSHAVIILKATRLCNLRCSYCNSWRAGPGNVMELDVLARVTRDVLRTPGITRVDFVWHGGEVTLLPPHYVKKALWLQQHFTQPETHVENSIQTNATCLTPEWIDLLSAHGFSVGVSIDGPPEIHDSRRLTVGGAGSWHSVRKGIERLSEAKIPFGALAVVDECVLDYGAPRYLQYLVDLGIQSVAILNAIPPNARRLADGSFYLPFQRYTRFLRDLFAEWWNKHRARIVIRELQSLLEAVRTGTTGLCIFRDNCMGRYLTIEPNGDVSACDKYVSDPDYVFGNVSRQELNLMLRTSDTLRRSSQDVAQKKHRMTTCSNYRYCFGGCPHDVRLNERHLRSWSGTCCGLYDLIEDMKSSIER